jgi:N-acetylglucosaminyldiphosphoundecaprenol N-acetyl-beta-D-mannosaminyltransferase
MNLNNTKQNLELNSPKADVLGRVVGLLLLVFFIPAFVFGAVLAPWGSMRSTPCMTQGGRTFGLVNWRWRGRLGRWLNASALAGWPRLIHLINGDMALVGLCPHPVADAPPSADIAGVLQSIPPGIFSLWELRHRNATDYDDFWAIQMEYARNRSLIYDCKLFFYNLLAMALHPLSTRTSASTVVVDTLRVDNLSLADALSRVVGQLDEPGAQPLHICFVNAAAVNLARRDARYRKAVNQAGLVLPEGLSIRYAAQVLKSPLLQRMDREFFVPRLWAAWAQRKGSVFLLGGTTGAAAAVARHLTATYPGLDVVGAEDCADWTGEADAALLERIRSSRADLLVTGCSAARQEIWIAAQAPVLGVKAILGLGAAFDLQGSGHHAMRQDSAGLMGQCGFALAVVLQRWLGSVSPMREMPVVVRPGDVQAPAHAVVLVGAKASDPLLQPLDVVPALLPVGSLRALSRVMEMLAEKGCRYVDLVTDVDELRLRELLGQGERWGLNIELHLAQDDSDILQRTSKLPIFAAQQLAHEDTPDHWVWLVDAGHWMPDGQLGDAIPTRPCVWVDSVSQQWAGWACLDRHHLRDCFNSKLDWSAWRYAVLDVVRHHAERKTVAGGADLRTLGGIMTMTDHPSLGVLEPANWHRYPASTGDAAQAAETEIWVSREAQVESGVQLTGPVYIGPGCHVASNAVLGPGVVLGRNVRIGSDMALSRAVVLDGVALDGGLDIREALVHERGIASFAWQVIVPSQALGNLLVGTEADQRL